MSKAYEANYSSPEWIALRTQIVDRDGGKCRNCGQNYNLEVHHWLPVAAEQNVVDERGYARDGDPLIVPESGLVTLCSQCHSALTAIRTDRETLYDPELALSGSKPRLRPKNVFELWAKAGQRTPFKVRKQSWNSDIEQFFLVEKIEIKRWPYGTAWGRYMKNGESAELQKIRGAGTYCWEFFIDHYDEENGRWWSGEILVAERPGHLSQDH